jgi:hypothetical protein
MELLRTGSRLSVQPVRPHEFEIVMQLASQPGSAEAATARGSKTKRPKSAAAGKSRKPARRAQ